MEMREKKGERPRGERIELSEEQRGKMRNARHKRRERIVERREQRAETREQSREGGVISSRYKMH